MGGVDLVVGERSSFVGVGGVGVSVSEVEADALEAGEDLFSFVDVEDGPGFEGVGAEVLNGAGDVLEGDVDGDDDGEIASGEVEAWERGHARDGGGGIEDGIEVEFGEEDGAFDFEVCGREGVEFAEESEGFAVEGDGGLDAVVEPWDGGIRGLEFGCCADGVEGGLEATFEIVDVPCAGGFKPGFCGFTPEEDGEFSSFGEAWDVLDGLRGENFTDLEEGAGFLLVCDVFEEGVDHAREHGCAHGAVFDAHGVGDFHGVGLWGIGREVEFCGCAWVHEGVVHGLVESGVDECVAEVVKACAWATFPDGGGDGVWGWIDGGVAGDVRAFEGDVREGGGEVVEPVSAADFLDDVDFSGDVGTPCGDAQGDVVGVPLGGDESDGFEEGFEFGAGEGFSEDLGDACAAEGELDGEGAAWVLVIDAGKPCRGIEGLVEEPEGALCGALDAFGIDESLVTVGAFGMETEAFGGFAHARGVECGEFKEDARRVFVDLGVETAHDSGDGDGVFPVGDDDILLIQGIFFVIDGVDGLAVVRASDEDCVGFEFVSVEGVHGVAEFKAYEVGDIDDVVDASSAARFDGAPQPCGAWSNFDAVGEDAEVSRAIVGGFEGDDGGGGDVGEGVELECARRALERSGEFASDAPVAEAVAAVGGEPDFKEIGGVGGDGLGDAEFEGLGECHARDGLWTESEECGVVGAEAKFFFATEHAVGGFTAEFGDFDFEVADLSADGGEGDEPSFLYPRGSADDADELAGSGVGVDEVEVVGVGVFGDVDEPGDDDVLYIGRIRGEAFDLESARGELSGGRGGVDPVCVDHILQPFVADDHGVFLEGET